VGVLAGVGGWADVRACGRPAGEFRGQANGRPSSKMGGITMAKRLAFVRRRTVTGRAWMGPWTETRLCASAVLP